MRMPCNLLEASCCLITMCGPAMRTQLLKTTMACCNGTTRGYDVA